MRWIERVASLVGGTCLAVLVVIVAGSVVARYGIGRPIAWIEEMAGLLMVWIVMISAVGAEARNEHLTIDIIEGHLSSSARRTLAIVVGLMSIGLLAVMAWYGWVLAEASLVRKTNILRIPWFWIYLPVVIGAIGVIVVTLLRIMGHRPVATSIEHGAEK